MDRRRLLTLLSLRLPAVDSINANRVRTLAMHEVTKRFAGLDAIVTPTGARPQLFATNLTGHPACIVPNGLRKHDGKMSPVSLTCLAPMGHDDKLLSVAHAYQRATDFHLQRPPL